MGPASPTSTEPFGNPNANPTTSNKESATTKSTAGDSRHNATSNLPFDPLTATAHDLSLLLGSGTITTVSLANHYLDRIHRYDPYLKSVISLPPIDTLLLQSRLLDAERSLGRLRSPLHGIPCLVKDNINTSPAMRMPTTCGALALQDAMAKENAAVVEQLWQAGLLVLGKANLSELAYFKGDKVHSAWSAVGGQTQSPYVYGGVLPDDRLDGQSNPDGSSSGSAVAVAAGLAPISIGTETCGSILIPSDRAALYGMKPTLGLVSLVGIAPGCKLVDSAGPMAKSVWDIAALLDCMVEPDILGEVMENGKGYTRFCEEPSWEGVRVGCVGMEADGWRIAEDETTKLDCAFREEATKKIEVVYEKMRKLGAKVVYPVRLIGREKLRADEGYRGLKEAFVMGYVKDFDAYLQEMESCKVRSVKEMVEFNEQHADVALPPVNPDQAFLVEAVAKSYDPIWTEDHVASIMKGVFQAGRDRGIDKVLAEHDVDIIVGPGSAGLVRIVSASGYPAISLPIGRFSGNGRPFGLMAIAKERREDLLLRFAVAWEMEFNDRPLPDAFQQHDCS